MVLTRAHSYRSGQILQTALVDLVELHLQLGQLSWSGTGEEWPTLRSRVIELGARTREFVEVVADRMLKLQLDPDISSDAVAAATTLPSCPTGTFPAGRLRELACRQVVSVTAGLRAGQAQLDSADRLSALLLARIVRELEARTWMLGDAEWLKLPHRDR